MMISANLVGFVIGTDGMTYMVKEIIGTWSGKSRILMLFGEAELK
jgi:hypothetical protein